MGYFIGIDPGQTGAIVIIDRERYVYRILDMPLTPNKEVDPYILREICKSKPDQSEPMCALEKAQFRPFQKGSFLTIGNYFIIKTVLMLEHIPFQEIPASKWKKEFSLIQKKGQPDKLFKGESVMKALELFPSIKKEQFYTPQGRMLDGRAEALLLAEYGRRHFK